MDSNGKKSSKKALKEIALAVSHLIRVNALQLSENDQANVSIALDLLAESLIDNGYIGFDEEGPQFEDLI